MNDEPKFTPGPWKAHAGIMEPDFVFYGEEERCDAENRVVCECFLRPGKYEMSADVHLIAAAPEMYEVLSTIEDIMCYDSSDCGTIPIDRMQKVLKKARGEEC